MSHDVKTLTKSRAKLQRLLMASMSKQKRAEAMNANLNRIVLHMLEESRSLCTILRPHVDDIGRTILDHFIEGITPHLPEPSKVSKPENGGLTVFTAEDLRKVNLGEAPAGGE